MQQANRYYRRSRIAEARFREFLRCFALDLTATQAAQMTGINLRTAKVLYQKLRGRIAEECEASSPLSGEIELDESYFGPTRVPGRRGRGAGRKIIVFGLLKRQGKLFTQIVPNVRRKTLQQIIQGRVNLDSVIYTDTFVSYHGLVDVGYSKHHRVQHDRDEFARGTMHINGIESFWSYAKRRLQKFNGIPAHTFYFHLKETEWRFNNRDRDMYRELLRLLREKPLNSLA